MRCWIGLVAGAFATLLPIGQARADDKTACIDADASGQELRLKGRWHDAVAQFQACTRLVCPGEVVEDCVQRFDDIQAAMPTLLVAATQPDGSDTVDADLLVDGVQVASSLPSTAIAVDPGQHTVRVEHEGWTATEQTIVVREREKNRRLLFALRAPNEEHAPNGGPNLLGIGMTAGGAVVTGVGLVFIALGLAERGVLLGEPCAHTQTCSASDVNGVQRDYVIGGIVGGVGLAALAFGIWELTLKPAHPTVGVTSSGLRFSF